MEEKGKGYIVEICKKIYEHLIKKYNNIDAITNEMIKEILIDPKIKNQMRPVFGNIMASN